VTPGARKPLLGVRFPVDNPALGRRTVGAVVETLPGLRVEGEEPVDGTVNGRAGLARPDEVRGDTSGRCPLPGSFGVAAEAVFPLPPKSVGRYRLGWAIRDVPDAEKGEVEPVLRLGIEDDRLLQPAPRVDSALLCESRGFWVGARLSDDSDVGLAIDRAVSGLMELSRASNGVTSTDVRSATLAKTRSISAAGLATAGDRVASAPLITTPVSRLEGMARSPETETRERLGLANSVSGTTVHPRRSISASWTRPLIATAWLDCGPSCGDGTARRPPEVRGGCTSRRFG
jgi:hypothetical protein